MTAKDRADETALFTGQVTITFEMPEFTAEAAGMGALRVLEAAGRTHPLSAG